MDLTAVEQLLREQHGVLSRRQANAAGLQDHDIARLLRHKDLTRVHNGVYVTHTGPLDWMQRAWAAVLFYSPATLCADSALVVANLRSAIRAVPSGIADPSATASQRMTPVIHVAVDERRRVSRIDGIQLHRITGLARFVQPNRSPSRVRLEHALLDVASRAPSDADAVALLADACQERRTTAARLVAAVQDRPNLPRRRFLLELLEDVATGAYSLLEHRYLTRVERPHGLPTARRQRRVTVGRTPAYRDVEYVDLAAVVELDGRLGHESTLDRWADLDRDIDSAIAGDTTIRLGWRHALEECRTADAVARLLQAVGWTGTPTPCGPGCSVRRSPARRRSGESSAYPAQEPPEPLPEQTDHPPGRKDQAQSWPSRRSSASSTVPS